MGIFFGFSGNLGIMNSASIEMLTRRDEESYDDTSEISENELTIINLRKENRDLKNQIAEMSIKMEEMSEQFKKQTAVINQMAESLAELTNQKKTAKQIIQIPQWTTMKTGKENELEEHPLRALRRLKRES